MDGEETVVVSKAELEELRRLKAELPSLLEKAKEEERKDALVRLHKRDKENPEGARQRAKRLYDLKKDEIKAKRRDAYQRKKAAKAAEAAAASSGTPGSASSLEGNSPDTR